jgi:hypothetical protein
VRIARLRAKRFCCARIARTARPPIQLVHADRVRERRAAVLARQATSDDRGPTSEMERWLLRDDLMLRNLLSLFCGFVLMTACNEPRPGDGDNDRGEARRISCCDPNTEPGTHGLPFCFEGASCCANGTWACNEGDGSTTCPGRKLCAVDTCCDLARMPGHYGAPCIEGASCCSDGSWACNEGPGTPTCDIGTICR